MPKKTTILIVLFCLVYVAARLWRLTDSCLWFDEIFSIHAAEHPWTEIIPFIAKDLIHPPLFYILLKLWIAAGGESLLWLRLFPVFFSVLALFPLWMLCRELKLEKVTVAVAFGLFAVNGALIKYAQEVRMYSLLLFFSLMSIWLFSRYYFRGKSFWVLVVANVLLVYAHYFGWFVVVSEVLVILAAQRIKILRTLLMLAVTAGCFVPWITALFCFVEPGSSIRQNIGWMERPGLISIFELIVDLVDPFYFQQSSADVAGNYPIALPILVIIMTAAVIYLLNFREHQNKERIFFLASFVAIPVFFAFLFSWFLPVSVWGLRHLLFIFAPATLLVSICVTEVEPKLLRHSIAAAIVFLAAVAFVQQVRTEPPRSIWCAWEDVAKEFVNRRNAAAQEKLYAFEELTAYHLWFSLRSSPGGSDVVLVKGTGVPENPAFFLPRGFDGVKVISETEITGEWVSLAFRAPEIDKTKPPLSNLISQGYEIRDVTPFPAGNSKAFLVRVKKK